MVRRVSLFARGFMGRIKRSVSPARAGGAPSTKRAGTFPGGAPLNAAVWMAAIVFAIALAVRLLFLFTSLDKRWPHSLYYEGDAVVWVEYARALNAGQAFESGLPIRSPGVAWLLHFVSPGRGFDFVALKAGWCVVSALGCAAAYLCYRRPFSGRAALLAAGMCTFSFASYVLATSLNNEALYTTVLMLIVLGTLQWVERGGRWLAVGMGTLHGVATLLRPEHTLLLVLMCGYIWWRSRGGERKAQIWQGIALTVVVSIAVCLPWSVRGSQASLRFNDTADALPDYSSLAIPWTTEAQAFVDGLPAFARAQNVEYFTFLARNEGASQMTRERAEALFEREFDYVPEPLSGFAFVSSQGPLSFALANHPEADGGFSKRALDARFATQENLNLSLPSHLRLYNRGYAVGLAFIGEDPARWLGLVGAKLRRFLDGWSHGFTGYDFPLGRGGVRQPVDMIAPSSDAAWVWRGALFGLFCAGLVAGVRRRVGGIWLVVIGFKLIVTVLFYGYARQAASILPAFFAFVALGADSFIVGPLARRWFSSRVWRASAIAVVALVVALEIVAASSVPPMAVEGQHRRSPEWGRHAITSYERLTLRPAPHT